MLTVIEKKMKTNQSLIKDDLVFLYETNFPIEGFGYRRDPRIGELRSQRNPEEDMPIVFECDKEQIARNISEIKEGTMAYVGPLVPGIFDRIQKRNIEHIYTTFPEGKIRKDPIEIGGKTAKELKSALDKSKINVSDYSENISYSDPSSATLELFLFNPII